MGSGGARNALTQLTHWTPHSQTQSSGRAREKRSVSAPPPQRKSRTSRRASATKTSVRRAESLQPVGYKAATAPRRASPESRHHRSSRIERAVRSHSRQRSASPSVQGYNQNDSLSSMSASSSQMEEQKYQGYLQDLRRFQAWSQKRLQRLDQELWHAHSKAAIDQLYADQRWVFSEKLRELDLDPRDAQRSAVELGKIFRHHRGQFGLFVSKKERLRVLCVLQLTRSFGTSHGFSIGQGEEICMASGTSPCRRRGVRLPGVPGAAIQARQCICEEEMKWLSWDRGESSNSTCQRRPS